MKKQFNYKTKVYEIEVIIGDDNTHTVIGNRKYDATLPMYTIKTCDCELDTTIALLKSNIENEVDYNTAKTPDIDPIKTKNEIITQLTNEGFI